MCYLVAGNIVVKRLPNNSLVKVPTQHYEQQTYVNLFKIANDYNQPHRDRLAEVFVWIDANKKTKCALGTELTSLIQKKAPPEDPAELKTHEKKLYLTAYNSYYDVFYLPQDVDLEE